MTTPMFLNMHRRAAFAAKRGQPVVVMPAEVRWLAENIAVAVPASESPHPWTWEEATEDMLRRIEDGTARLFGRHVVLGPLRSVA